ncbi:MAG: sulfatase-like hydrolase/transferase [Planctomycetota bacterium]
MRKRPSSGWHRVLLGLIMLIIVGAAWYLLRAPIFRKEVRNVLLISIDTCRADYLGCYGYPRRISPNIDAVAGEAILFENASTSVPLTLPAHSTMLTGTTPLYHRIHDNLGYKLGASNITLSEIMHEHGYTTGAIVSSFVLDSKFGLDQGFDSYNDRFEQEVRGGYHSERKGDEATRLAIKWLEENKDDKFLLFLHYFDPHHRYEPPEPYASEFADDLYAGEIAYTDHCIGQVIDSLKDMGLYESTLIIIVGDHGEMLGEHGEAEHGYFIYQSAIRVPLVFKLPGRNRRNRVSNVVSLTDIVPTVCATLGIPPPAHAHGKDLSEYFSRKTVSGQARFVYCESLTPTKHNANALVGVVSDGWKYIQTTRPELYNLSKDPYEGNDLSEKEPQMSHFLREHLKAIMEEQTREGDSDSKLELDEETRKRLESLGYLSSGSMDDKLEFDQSRDDPKDLIKFHNIKAYNETATHLVQKGKLKEAAEAYDKVIRHYEKAKIKHAMGTIHFNFAATLGRLGKHQQSQEQYGKAIEEFRRELADNPNSARLWTRLGDALASTGNFGAAADAFKKALSLNPARMLSYEDLARALEFQGRYDEAVQVLEKGIRFMLEHQEKGDATKLQEYLEALESAKAKDKEQNNSSAP